MAVVINGSGTVTGLAVGGLPDGVVDSDTLASNAVVTGKIADGTIANADINDLAASKLTGALPAISGASLTGIDSALTPAFCVSGGHGTVNSGTEQKISFGSEVFDTDSAFDTSNYKFTVPSGKGGNYAFNLIVHLTSSWFFINNEVRIRVNNSQVRRIAGPWWKAEGAGQTRVIHANFVIPLSAGDYVEVYSYATLADGGTTETFSVHSGGTGSTRETMWSMFRIG